VYDSRLHAQAVSQLRRETELRRGLERGEIQVYYQPVFDIHTGKVTGFEALARWQHPERGLLLPGEFIPLAEESGLITSLGSFVLREACRQLAAWHANGVARPDQIVSVNVSSRQFADPGFVETVANTLQETGLAPACLYLEITETVILENAEASALMMNRLKQLGVRLALDDFGTGYSALSYLHRFPIDSLKVDRSFISDLVGSSTRAAIVGAIVTLAHNLRLDVVAEGIETEAQRDVLRALECEFGQGFLYSRPLPPEAAQGLLQRQAQGVTAAQTEA
jgi:EAL domain-containing protein (putative c-di-GMP-specific phosphodiesterase class I)